MAPVQVLEQHGAMWSAERRARVRAAKRRSAFYCRIELVPLLGMLIALLIIFMIIILSYMKIILYFDQKLFHLINVNKMIYISFQLICFI